MHVVAIAAGLSGTACAAWPEKPIRVVMPYAAGGTGDLILRLLQSGLEKRLGQSLVIDYRTGAAGNIGVQEVVKAPADGYTLLFGPTNNFVINQFLYRNLGFDPLQALVPVTIVADTPYLAVISDTLPARNYAEFSAYARANAGKLNYGSPGSATVPHLSGFMLSEAIGAGLVHVPYRGSLPATQALLANDVQLMIHSYGLIAGHLASGKLRALAVGAAERIKALPGVPTTAELGIPAGVIPGNWWALAAPRGTEPAIINRLALEIRAVLEGTELQKKYFEQGWIAGGAPPAEVAERMRNEAPAWKRVVERSGAKADN
ncbi:MAG: tripartite tricarboxylate transporter substrate binding protein [Betaproteobacteria bacterium]|nr:tripartite tricarboxylate transporter substrate binding protein [Betaproteobacteria bacterium]